MAFGGLLDGFLNEKPIGETTKIRHIRYDIHRKGSLAGTSDDKMMIKKLSTASYAGQPTPKYSFTATHR